MANFGKFGPIASRLVRYEKKEKENGTSNTEIFKDIERILDEYFLKKDINKEEYDTLHKRFQKRLIDEEIEDIEVTDMKLIIKEQLKICEELGCTVTEEAVSHTILSVPMNQINACKTERELENLLHAVKFDY